jgi:hypothetical protein
MNNVVFKTIFITFGSLASALEALVSMTLALNGIVFTQMEFFFKKQNSA